MATLQSQPGRSPTSADEINVVPRPLLRFDPGIGPRQLHRDISKDEAERLAVGHAVVFGGEQDRACFLIARPRCQHAARRLGSPAVVDKAKAVSRQEAFSSS